jgi:hypothetical protein
MKESSKVIAHIVKFLDILSDSTFTFFFFLSVARLWEVIT